MVDWEKIQRETMQLHQLWMANYHMASDAICGSERENIDDYNLREELEEAESAHSIMLMSYRFLTERLPSRKGKKLMTERKWDKLLIWLFVGAMACCVIIFVSIIACVLQGE